MKQDRAYMTYNICSSNMENKYKQQLLKWHDEVPTDVETTQYSDDLSDAPAEHYYNKTDTDQSAESEVDDVQPEVAANITEQISVTAPRFY